MSLHDWDSGQLALVKNMMAFMAAEHDIAVRTAAEATWPEVAAIYRAKAEAYQTTMNYLRGWTISMVRLAPALAAEPTVRLIIAAAE